MTILFNTVCDEHKYVLKEIMKMKIHNIPETPNKNYFFVPFNETKYHALVQEIKLGVYL